MRAQRAAVSSIEVVDELDFQDRPIHQDLSCAQHFWTEDAEGHPWAYGLADACAPVLALPGTPQAAQHDDRSGHDSDMSSDEPVSGHDSARAHRQTSEEKEEHDDACSQNFSSRVLEENSFSPNPGGFRCISCYACRSHLLCSVVESSLNIE